MDKRCSVLLSTCDNYQDAWLPFFCFFKKYWSDCPYSIYINTETKKYTDEDLKITMINVATNSWSTRLKKALKEIKTDYIVFLLEDFFFLDYVDQSEIEHCLDIMDSDKKISVIDFETDEKSCGNIYPSDNNYCERKSDSIYYLNCQTAIWRRKDLIKFLSPYESPWQFEIYGSQRVKIYNKKFLLKHYGKNVFTYNVNWNTGYGIHNGKWLYSNVLLFKENGINVSFNKMGFFESDIQPSTCPPPKVSLKYKIEYLFLSGGNIKHRMPIKEQIQYMIKRPKDFLCMVKYKIKKCLSEDFFNY